MNYFLIACCEALNIIACWYPKKNNENFFPMNNIFTYIKSKVEILTRSEGTVTDFTPTYFKVSTNTPVSHEVTDSPAC
jgi:hypothetical protein